MRRESIDISGSGDHVIVPSVPGRMIMATRILLTFSHAAEQALRVTFKDGSKVIGGPFYVSDGGDIDYTRGPAASYVFEDDFIINLDEGLSASGMIEYEVGSW